MKIWVSKYALTKGVIESDVNEHRGALVMARIVDGGYLDYYRMGAEAHDTLDGARAAAEVMRVKKINNLKKQLAKLEKMAF
jgi:hypothetical protein